MIKPPIPFPKIPPTVLWEITKVIYGLVKVFIDKTSKEAGNTKPVTASSTVEDVMEINTIFLEFQRKANAEASAIEEKTFVEIEVYIEEVLFVVDNYEKLLTKYDIRTKNLKQRISRIKRDLSGRISLEVSKEMAMTNPQCATILKMLPGQKKEDAFKQFLEKTLQKALDFFAKTLTEEILYAIESFQEEVSEQLGQIKKQHDLELTAYNQLEGNAGSLEEQKQIVQAEAKLLIVAVERLVEGME